MNWVYATKLKPWFLDEKKCVLSRFRGIWLFVILWTTAQQAPLSMGFSRQEYWSGWPCPPPGDLLEPGIKPVSLTSSALAGGFLPLEPPVFYLFAPRSFRAHCDISDCLSEPFPYTLLAGDHSLQLVLTPWIVKEKVYTSGSLKKGVSRRMVLNNLINIF